MVLKRQVKGDGQEKDLKKNTLWNYTFGEIVRTGNSLSGHVDSASSIL